MGVDLFSGIKSRKLPYLLIWVVHLRFLWGFGLKIEWIVGGENDERLGFWVIENEGDDNGVIRASIGEKVLINLCCRERGDDVYK